MSGPVLPDRIETVRHVDPYGNETKTVTEFFPNGGSVVRVVDAVRGDTLTETVVENPREAAWLAKAKANGEAVKARNLAKLMAQREYEEGRRPWEIELDANPMDRDELVALIDRYQTALVDPADNFARQMRDSAGLRYLEIIRRELVRLINRFAAQTGAAK